SFLPIQPTADEIAEKLTFTGLEVSSVKNMAAGMEKVVVAKIEKTRPHPNADRLTLCEVTSGIEKFNIVCGAHNMKEGDHVALALPGATLPNGMSIKKSKIRGEPSEGMLCSESELGFSETSEGILILLAETKLGDKLADALGRNDWLLEFEITPNRGDCLSVIGLVREITAAFGVAAKVPTGEAEGPTEGAFRAVVHDTAGSPRYALRQIDSLAAKPTPSWMKQRLEAAGVRSINNLVDVTNYVMIEWGQPLHAFDRDKVVESIQVRRAKDGETIDCLDGVERQLMPEDLVIADGKGPVAIAGVMGGQRAAVSEKTKAILLESAHFDPKSVRRTARRLGLHTESSHRFERWVDPANVWSASQRAVDLYAEAAGGKEIGGMECRIRPFAHRKIHLRQGLIQRILGEGIKNAGEYLARLGLPLEKKEDGWMVEIPSRRSDLEREIDLVEEVARLYGYDRIPSKIPPLMKEPQIDGLFDRVSTVRNLCRGAGLVEIRGYSFGKAGDQEQLGHSHLGKAIRLANPIASDQEVMRQSLLPTLLSAWNVNRTRQVEGARLFEIGSVFGESDGAARTPAREELHLGILMAGKTFGRGWHGKSRTPDFYDAKGIVEVLSAEMGWGAFAWKQEEVPSYLHPGRASVIYRGAEKIGEAGLLHPRIERSYESGRAVFVDLHLGSLFVAGQKTVRIKTLSAYPHVRRDIAIVVKSDIPSETIEAEILKVRDPLLQSVELFDVYEGKGVPSGQQSNAYSLVFASPERTLTEVEVDAVLTNIVVTLESKLGAKLRT
ncbi:MAG TPA: phenylalanine--tRNA ligase subunit beta, partial [Bdellovibrionota bacterium]|nr:phenylalanine--tRNA ligase subunit beta [Bdellovibrionota bacterium]